MSASSQLEQNVAQVRAVAEHDPRAARLLAAYVLRRASVLPAPLRATAEGELGPVLRGGDEGSADAERYARLRVEIADLEARARTGLTAPIQAVESHLATHARIARLRGAQTTGIALSVISLVAAVVMIATNVFVLVVVLGAVAVLLAIAARLIGWLALLAESDATGAEEHERESLAFAQMARDASEARGALLAGEEGRWLRDTIARHPSLAFEGIEIDRAPYRG